MKGHKAFRLLTVLFWLVFLVLAWLAVRSVPLSAVVATFQRLNPGWVAVLAATNLFILLMISFRWAYLLKALGHPVPLQDLVLYRLAAFGVSYFTPGSQFGGEPLQVQFVRWRNGLSSAEAVASVTLDKLLELLANFMFLAFGILIVIQQGFFPGLLVWQALAFALAAAGLPLVYLVALWRGKTPFSRLGKKLQTAQTLRPALHLVHILSNAEMQASLFCRRKPRQVLAALAISLLVWAVMVAEYWLSLAVLDLPLRFVQVIAAITAARMAFLLPAPGGLGTLEVSQVLVMQALGFSPAFGASIALLIRGRDVLLALAGLLFGAALSRARGFPLIRSGGEVSFETKEVL